MVTPLLGGSEDADGLRVAVSRLEDQLKTSEELRAGLEQQLREQWRRCEFLERELLNVWGDVPKPR